MNPLLMPVSVLLAVLRYMYNNQVEEELSMCKPLPVHNTGVNIFSLTDLCMAEKGFSVLILNRWHKFDSWATGTYDTSI
jgi:hypothetical protein